MKTSVISCLFCLICVCNASAQVLDSLACPNASTTVLPKSFNHGFILDASQLIQGRMPGLTVSRPGADPNQAFELRARGLNSMIGEVQPLFVLDGMPMSDFSLIDPASLGSVTLAKDALSADIGLRAAPGVLYWQSRNVPDGPFRIQYDAQIALDKASKRYDVLGAAAFIARGGSDLSPNSNTDTDWQSLVLRNGISHNHHLEIGSGIGNGGLLFFLNYRDVQGILKESAQQQYNGSFRFQQTFWKERIRLDGTAMAAHRNANLSFPEAMRYAITFNPSASVKSTESAYAEFGGYVQQSIFDMFNPVAILEQNANKSQQQLLMGTIRSEIDLWKGLTGMLQLGRETRAQLSAAFYSPESMFRGRSTGYISAQDQSLENNYLHAQARYQFKLNNKSRILASTGYYWQQFNYETLDVNTTSLGNSTLESSPTDLKHQASTSTNHTEDDQFGRNTLIGYYTQATYNFNQTFFLSAGWKNEGSSRFGANEKWTQLPNFGAAVDFARIFLVPQTKALKLRASYGMTAQQPYSDALSKQNFRPYGLFFYNDTLINTYYAVNNENPDLKREITATTNIGIDFRGSKDHLHLSLDYFKQKSSDLLSPVYTSLPPNLASVTYMNIGSIESTGWETSISWEDLIQSSNFHYTPEFVLNTVKSKVQITGSDETQVLGYIGSPGFCCGAFILVEEGREIGTFWGPVRNQINPDGSIAYKDLNHDGNINLDNYNQDQTNLGRAMPKLSLGFNNRLQWKSLELNLFLRGLFGQQMVHSNRLFYETNANTEWNMVKTAYYNPKVTDYNRFDNTFVEKASFLKIDNLCLSYNLPLAEKSRLQTLRFYFAAQNLLLFTPYSGLDPELRLSDPGPTDNGSKTYNTSNPLVPGIDRRTQYFPSKTFSLGVSIGL